MSLQRETAVTLHFLVAGFHSIMDDNDNILEPLALGEDGFSYQCYDLAEAIETLNLNVQKDRDCPGVYHYEIIEDTAAHLLFDYVNKHASIPLVLEFIRQFKPLLEKWYEGEGS